MIVSMNPEQTGAQAKMRREQAAQMRLNTLCRRIMDDLILRQRNGGHRHAQVAHYSHDGVASKHIKRRITVVRAVRLPPCKTSGVGRTIRNETERQSQ